MASWPRTPPLPPPPRATGPGPMLPAPPLPSPFRGQSCPMLTAPVLRTRTPGPAPPPPQGLPPPHLLSQVRRPPPHPRLRRALPGVVTSPWVGWPRVHPPDCVRAEVRIWASFLQLETWRERGAGGTGSRGATFRGTADSAARAAAPLPPAPPNHLWRARVRTARRSGSSWGRPPARPAGRLAVLFAPPPGEWKFGTCPAGPDRGRPSSLLRTRWGESSGNMT
ncbi:WAS/WASL-interacting protein family member 3-like isoform X2 [Oryctolagus cuniculus]|uniref:WAS/WASL-interacting protein family member 3-like isoform X2 n=1 Tax=Oryctolagus cuniculus TaxID=9986 RepID=UPI003879684E